MSKKLAFISDIHGNIEALRNVLKDIENRRLSMDDVYCLGDLVGYGPRPNEVIEIIKEYSIQSILGNYDEAVAFYLPTCGCHANSESDKAKTQNSLDWTVNNTSNENKEYLREFEENVSLLVENYSILLTHGSPLSINDYVFEEDTDKQEQIAEDLDEDIIVFGHTHYPYVKKVKDKIFINAGSVGRPKDGDNRACYCIVELCKEIKVEFVRVPYDIEKMAKEIEESQLLDSFAQTLRTGRDNK